MLKYINKIRIIRIFPIDYSHFNSTRCCFERYLLNTSQLSNTNVKWSCISSWLTSNHNIDDLNAFISGMIIAFKHIKSWYAYIHLEISKPIAYNWLYLYLTKLKRVKTLIKLTDYNIDLNKNKIFNLKLFCFFFHDNVFSVENKIRKLSIVSKNIWTVQKQYFLFSLDVE